MIRFLEKRWALGYRDRGMGRGDFAVVVEGSDELIVKTHLQEVAEHIITTHNSLLDEGKCPVCMHATHEPGKCVVLYVYERGPSDPPGNQWCLCGHDFKTHTFQGNDGMDG